MNVYISRTVFRKAKFYAARKGLSLREAVEQLLADALEDEVVPVIAEIGGEA